MKIKNLFLSGLACLAMTACSNNDEPGADNDLNMANGEKTYLAISLVTDNSANARGDVGNPEFIEATKADEGDINTVAFLFYDASGNAVSPNTGFFSADNLGVHEFEFTTTVANKNIETVGKAVIEFEDLPNNSAPRYVLALLNITNNQYTDLKDKTKSQALATIYTDVTNGASWCNTFKVDGKDVTYYVMSNSTYQDESNNTIDATPIVAGNFVNIEAGNDAIKAQAVEVYVERMAAKVEVKRTSAKNTITSAVVQQGSNAATSTNLTVEIVNWGLNAINDDAYLFKHIDFTTAPTFTWNSASNHRSYWAKDNDYDSGIYPTDYNLTTNGKLNGMTNASLIYKSANAMTKSINEVDYCNENTLTADQNETVAATSVLVIAKFKIGETEIGENNYLYNYNGVLYDETNYKNAAAEQLDSKLTSIYVKKTVDEKTSYVDIAPTDLTNYYISDGYTAYKLNTEWTADTYYKDAEGKEAWDRTELEDKIKEITKANAFRNGLMYYSIPLEHEGAEKNLGEYGVVRNHWYELTIGDVKKLGKGIYEPNEIIVPNTEETKFGLAAKLNVLSWRIINQKVDLQ